MFSYRTEIHPIKTPRNKLRAYGSLVIEGTNNAKLKVKGFKIFDGTNGLFCKPPQSKGKDKEGNDTYYDDIQFIDDDESNTFRTEVYTAFVSAYNQLISNMDRSTAAQSQDTYNQQSTNNKPLW